MLKLVLVLVLGLFGRGGIRQGSDDCPNCHKHLNESSDTGQHEAGLTSGLRDKLNQRRDKSIGGADEGKSQGGANDQKSDGGAAERGQVMTSGYRFTENGELADDGTPVGLTEEKSECKMNDDEARIFAGINRHRHEKHQSPLAMDSTLQRLARANAAQKIAPHKWINGAAADAGWKGDVAAILDPNAASPDIAVTDMIGYAPGTAMSGDQLLAANRWDSVGIARAGNSYIAVFGRSQSN